MQGEDRAGAGRADDGATGGPEDRWAGDGLRRADSGAAQEWPRTPPHEASPGHRRPQVVIEGRYELLEPIGSGGMGEVWKAHDLRLRRFVAIKGLLDRNAMTAGTQAAAMQRARREAEAIAKIEHPNVVTVHDQVETDNQVWIVMKLLEARPARLLRGEVREPVRARREGAAGGAGQPDDGARAQHDVAAPHTDTSRALQHDQEHIEHVLLMDPDLRTGRQPHKIGVQLPPRLGQMPQRAALVGRGGGEDVVQYGEDPGSRVHGAQVTQQRHRVGDAPTRCRPSLFTTF
ncbi:Serine/threonine-protein kinase PknD [Streptomyces microflavus]